MHPACPLIVDQNAQTYTLQVLQHEMRLWMASARYCVCVSLTFAYLRHLLMALKPVYYSLLTFAT